MSRVLVVILLLPRRHPDVFVERGFFPARAAARRGFGGGVAAIVAAADLFLGVQPLEDEVEGRCDGRGGRAAWETGLRGQLAQPLHAARPGDHFVGGRAVAERQRSAQVEPFDDGARVHAVEHAGEHRADGGTNQVARDLFRAPKLAFILELVLAGDRRQRGVDVGDAQYHERLAMRQRAALGIRDDELERADRKPLADAGSLVDLAIGPRLERDLFDDFADVGRDLDLQRAGALGPRFLPGNRHRVAARHRIVRADLRADAVLERRDDLPARRVVLRVRREDEHDVELQPDRIALNLDVAFLQDVEQADLDLAGEIGQLVDREDAPVRPRQQPVMHRQLVGEVQPRLGGLDGIDVADHVRDRHIRRRQLFDEPLLATQPADREAVAFLRGARAARGAERRQRVVVNLAAGDDRDPFVQQIDEVPQDAALRLTPQAEQNEVVARQDGVDELRNHRLVVADDAGEERLARSQPADQVVADFLFNRPRAIARLPQVTEGLNGRHEPILTELDYRLAWRV